MAEYIKREDMLALIQKAGYCDCAGQVCYSVGNSDLIALPTADVIERSKVDEAIEQIRSLQIHDHEDDFYDCKYQALEILKRNIGE